MIVRKTSSVKFHDQNFIKDIRETSKFKANAIIGLEIRDKSFLK